jgi:NAD(P)-dependent dehydrogenase (short-subunit alcohol dehydrogenase family)
MTPMKGIEGRVAIITGTASGIGAGLVKNFVADGARLVCTDIQGDGEKLVSDFGDNVVFVRADLRVDADIARIVEAATSKFGQIDFLINCAATYVDKGATSTRAEWLNGFDCNLVGHVMLLQAALPHLKKSTNPSIINFSSESAHVGLAGRWIYPATKSAIEQVTRSEALDLAEFGIRVNSVMPGWTRKPFHDTAPDEVVERYRNLTSRLHMLKRMGTLDEVAQAVLFLCSEHASFITGSCMRVDGGHSALGPQGLEVHLPSEIRKAAGVKLK